MFLNLMLIEDSQIGIIISVVITGAIILLALVAFMVAILKRAKYIKKPKNILNEVDNALILAFGENNILDVQLEMSRITVTVKDVQAVNAERIKELGASGVLLVGNMVKCSFKDNIDNIYNQLKGAITNE